MRKNLLLSLLFSCCYFLQAQTKVATADLLDLKFSTEGEAIDVSKQQFKIQKGSTIPHTVYDPSIKQYVSSFRQFKASTSNNFYKIDYKDDLAFQTQLKKSFTLEVYTKNISDWKMTAVGSMQSGGFGMEQINKGGATQLWFYKKNTNSYTQIGSLSTYDTNPAYYHIVYTYDGNTLKSYYNGSSKDILSNVGALQLSSDRNALWIAIGGDVTPNSYTEFPYNGDIAIVRMYSNALSDKEVLGLHNQLSERKKLSNADDLNKLISESLPEYISNETSSSKKNEAKQYLAEAWGLMESFDTTFQQISDFIKNVKTNLGITIPSSESNHLPRFAVISDIHIGSGAMPDWNIKVPRALEILKTQNPKLDAIFVAGDITDQGSPQQFTDTKNIFSAVSPTVPVYYCMGNHDWHNNAVQSGNDFKNILGQNLNQYIEIKGYPFISISMDNSYQKTAYNTATRNFLSSSLENATKKHPGKPIFLIMHVAAKNTVYGSDSWETTTVQDILEKYPQIIAFSGHSHYTVGDERSISQDKFTAINDGGVSYGGLEDEMDDVTQTNYLRFPPEGNTITEGCVVAVEENNDVTVKRLDFTRNEKIKQPWVIKAPHNGTNFTYKGRTGGKAPYFSKTAKPILTKIKDSYCTVTFPQAKDDDMVHHYVVQVWNKAKKEVEKNYTITSRFYLNSEMPDSLSWNITGLTTFKEYTIRVKAVDSFSNISEEFIESDPFIASRGYSNIKNVYIIGPAISGWDVNNPTKMTPIAGRPGVFSWEGLMNIGEFKFIMNKGYWNPSVNALTAQDVVSKKSFGLKVTNGSAEQGDYKFKITEEMYYTVEVDTENWTMKATRSRVGIHLYVVGAATIVGWDNVKALEMTQSSKDEDVYTWTGHLDAAAFKFITKLGTWNSIIPNGDKNESIINGYKHKISKNYQRGDYVFNILNEGDYTITVNLDENSMIVKKLPNNDPIYLIGSAITAGWENTKGIEMDSVKGKEGIYFWKGHLNAAEFKFITKLGTWRSIVPSRAAHENIVSGYKHEISNNFQGDYKFNILNAGEYTITVNLAENSMIVKNLQNDDPLYIVGSATPVGWDVNNPTEMTPIPGRPGVFSWEGMMNLGEFKFLTNKGRWNPSVNAPRAQNVVSGKSFDLKVTNGSAEQGDYKFKITDDMHYKVEVNTENWTMRATGSRAGIPLYVVGAATTVGWDNFKALKMTQSSKDEDVYTWTGHLDAAAFKFITKLGTWNSIVPNRVADENIVSGYKHEISKNNQGNYVFNILNAGDYTITVNLAENSMIVKKLQNNDPLYIVGSATPVGWDNFNALKMTQVGNLYTWEGMMNLGEFKFLTNKGHWNPSVNAPRAQNVVSGDFFDLKVTNGSAEQGDYKFKITEELYYTVIVDTENWTMKATGSKMGIPLYVVGAATTVGWDNFKALKMTQSSKDEDVYTWTGPLKEAQFKFITKLGTWNSIVPNRAKDESIINGYKHEISKNDQGNYVFNILNEGDYTITVNLADNSMIVKKLPKNEPIYLIGSATTAGWDNTKEISMNEVGEGIYSWRGYLKAEQFKFITKLGTWHSIIPNRAAHENIVKGYKHKISNNFQGDYKFNIIDAGTYTITVDLNEKTMLVNNYKMQNMSLSNTDAFTVVALQGSAMVRINSELKADRARLLDITGNVLDVVKDKTKVFYLGYNVPAGVYIVEMIHNNQVFTKKVLIK